MLWWDSTPAIGDASTTPEDPCDNTVRDSSCQPRPRSVSSASSGGSSSSRAEAPARAAPYSPYIQLLEVQRFDPRSDGSWEAYLLRRWAARRQWPKGPATADANVANTVGATGATEHEGSGCFSEYVAAWRLICLDDSLMSTSRVGRTLDQLQQGRRRADGGRVPFAGTVSDVLGDFYDVFEPSLLLVLKKAFGLRTDVAARNENRPVPVVADHRGNFFDAAVQMWSALPLWKKPVMSQALRELLVTEDRTGLQVILGMIKSSVQHCNAGKVDVWSKMLLRVVLPADPLLSNAVETEGSWRDELGRTLDLATIVQRRRALHRLWEAALEFTDDWKEKALSTVFLEPTKMYYIACGEKELADNVEVHGASVYLAVLLSTLGVRCPRAPFFLDTPISAVSFLDVLDGNQLRALWRPENFGKPFTAVSECSEPKSRGHVANHYSNFLFNGRQPWQIANNAVDKNTPAERRRQLQPYLVQFAWYFSEQFILPRLIQHLLEHDDTRDALQVVYDEIRQDDLLPEEVTGARAKPVGSQSGPQPTDAFHENDVCLWLWDIEVLPAVLVTENAARLLRHAGIFKAVC